MEAGTTWLTGAWLLGAWLFGLIIGSFLNVCIHRWPRNRSVIKPRSHCVRCRKLIAWYDNIPLFSYLLLRGRCRHCGTRISWRYPLVELLTGLLFVAIVLVSGPVPLDTDKAMRALKLCVFSAMLVALIFTDLEKRILPDELTIGGMLIGFVFAAFVPVPDVMAKTFYWLVTRGELPVWLQSPAESGLGALMPALLLKGSGWLYLKIRRREGLGFGDVKLVAMIGSFLGLSGALLALLVGSIGGTIISLSYIKATGKDPATYELPFGSFLGVAAIAVALGLPNIMG